MKKSSSKSLWYKPFWDELYQGLFDIGLQPTNDLDLQSQIVSYPENKTTPPEEGLRSYKDIMAQAFIKAGLDESKVYVSASGSLTKGRCNFDVTVSFADPRIADLVSRLQGVRPKLFQMGTSRDVIGLPGWIKSDQSESEIVQIAREVVEQVGTTMIPWADKIASSDHIINHTLQSSLKNKALGVACFLIRGQFEEAEKVIDEIEQQEIDARKQYFNSFPERSADQYELYLKTKQKMLRSNLPDRTYIDAAFREKVKEMCAKRTINF